MKSLQNMNRPHMLEGNGRNHATMVLQKIRNNQPKLLLQLNRNVISTPLARKLLKKCQEICYFYCYSYQPWHEDWNNTPFTVMSKFKVTVTSVSNFKRCHYHLHNWHNLITGQTRSVVKCLPSGQYNWNCAYRCFFCYTGGKCYRTGHREAAML